MVVQAASQWQTNSGMCPKNQVSMRAGEICMHSISINPWRHGVFLYRLYSDGKKFGIAFDGTLSIDYAWPIRLTLEYRCKVYCVVRCGNMGPLLPPNCLSINGIGAEASPASWRRPRAGSQIWNSRCRTAAWPSFARCSWWPMNSSGYPQTHPDPGGLMSPQTWPRLLGSPGCALVGVVWVWRAARLEPRCLVAQPRGSLRLLAQMFGHRHTAIIP